MRIKKLDRGGYLYLATPSVEFLHGANLFIGLPERRIFASCGERIAGLARESSAEAPRNTNR